MLEACTGGWCPLPPPLAWVLWRAIVHAQWSTAEACRQRAGIPDASDPLYGAKRELYYGAYVDCMLKLGHTDFTFR